MERDESRGETPEAQLAEPTIELPVAVPAAGERVLAAPVSEQTSIPLGSDQSGELALEVRVEEPVAESALAAPEPEPPTIQLTASQHSAPPAVNQAPATAPVVQPPTEPPMIRFIERSYRQGSGKSQSDVEGIDISTLAKGKYVVRPRGVLCDQKTRIKRTLSAELTSEGSIDSDDVSEKAQQIFEEWIIKAGTAVADTPHRGTIVLGLLSPMLAIAALFISYLSFNIAERNMKVSQRSYLNVVSGSATLVWPNSADGTNGTNGRLRVTTMIKNEGNTPARVKRISLIANVHGVIDIVDATTGLPVEPPVIFESSTTSLTPAYLSPKAETPIAYWFDKIPRRVFERVDITTALDLQLRLEFEDVFADTHVNDWCWLAYPSGRMNNEFLNLKVGGSCEIDH